MNNIKGFTLIETLVYLALFGIIIGGVTAGIYAIIEGSGRTQSKIMLQDEGGFLTAKINWALTGASGFSITANPLALSINKFFWPANPLVFSLSGNDMILSEGAAPGQALNGSAVTVSSLVFQDIPAQAGRPEGVTASFTLTILTPNGFVISQDFETTKYLRK